MKNISLRQLRYAGLEIIFGSTHLLFDPFFTKIKIRHLLGFPISSEVKTIRNYIESADKIFLTHAHIDHVFDTPEIIRLTGAQAYGSPNCAQIIARHGVASDKINVVVENDIIRGMDYEVKVLSGKHPAFLGRPILAGNIKPGKLSLNDYKSDGCLSYLVKTGKYSFMIFNGEETIPQEQVDVLFLRPYLSVSYIAKLLTVLKPGLIVPSHREKPAPVLSWLSFLDPLFGEDDMSAFNEKLSLAGYKGQVLFPETYGRYYLDEILESC